MNRFCVVLSAKGLVPIGDTTCNIKTPIRYAFNSRSVAEENAASLAAKTPGEKFLVLECVTAFEGLPAKVIPKKFNDDGEFVNA